MCLYDGFSNLKKQLLFAMNNFLLQFLSATLDTSSNLVSKHRGYKICFHYRIETVEFLKIKGSLQIKKKKTIKF